MVPCSVALSVVQETLKRTAVDPRSVGANDWRDPHPRRGPEHLPPSGGRWRPYDTAPARGWGWALNRHGRRRLARTGGCLPKTTKLEALISLSAFSTREMHC